MWKTRRFKDGMLEKTKKKEDYSFKALLSNEFVWRVRPEQDAQTAYIKKIRQNTGLGGAPFWD